MIFKSFKKEIPAIHTKKPSFKWKPGLFVCCVFVFDYMASVPNRSKQILNKI